MGNKNHGKSRDSSDENEGDFYDDELDEADQKLIAKNSQGQGQNTIIE